MLERHLVAEKTDYWQLVLVSRISATELSHAGIQQVLKSRPKFQSRQDPMGQCMAFMAFRSCPTTISCSARTPDGGVIAMHQNSYSSSQSNGRFTLFTEVSISKWATEVQKTN